MREIYSGTQVVSVRNGNFGKHRLLTPIQKPMKSVSNTTDCGVLHRGLGSTNSSSHKEENGHLEAIPVTAL